MKTLINFKKFSINEDYSQQSLSQKNINLIKGHLTVDILDHILHSIDEESIESIRSNIPFMYDMLLNRANSRGIPIEKIIRFNKVIKYV
jgi:hypothetical protein